MPEIVLVASGLPFQGAFTFTPCILCKIVRMWLVHDICDPYNNVIYLASSAIENGERGSENEANYHTHWCKDVHTFTLVTE